MLIIAVMQPTLVRSPLDRLLAFHARTDPLTFAAATVTQAAARGRMARLVVMSRTWDRLRGQG